MTLLYTLGAEFNFSASLGTGRKLHIPSIFATSCPILADGEPPSKSPKATTRNHHFLPVIHPLGVAYVSMQALSRQVQCFIRWGAQATPEALSSLFGT
jgi:hypothetical protein